MSVRFWFDITPTPGSQVSPGTPYSVVLNCEPSQVLDLYFWVAVDPWRPDGTVIGPASAPSFALGAVNRGVPLRVCNSKLDTWLPVQEPFDAVAHLRMRVWLLPSPFNGTYNLSTIPPHMEVTESVNWTR